MPITDDLLEEVAKALAGESYSRSSHQAYTEEVSPSYDGSEDSLSGEFGSRNSVSTSRNGSTVTVTALRVGAGDIVDSANGDTLTGTALFDASSAGQVMLIEELPQINHTEAFDISFEWTLEVSS